MERITIICEEEDCKQEYPFNQTLEHRRKCLAKKTPCVKGCENGRLYKGIEAHLTHVNEECIKATVICQKCRFKCTRADYSAHNCVEGFINQINPDDASSLKTVLSEMKTQFNEKISAAEQRL